MNDLSASSAPSSAQSPAVDLLRRWDAQQTAYIKHRDQRFDAMAETVARLCGESPRILDLACGPGSTSVAILNRLPMAKIVAVDKDPALLAIARDVFANTPNVEVLECDLETSDWPAGTEGAFDAVISSTALHWLSPDALARLYFALADRLRVGGVFLNADHLLYGRDQPTLAALAKQDDESNQSEAFGSGTDTWDGWWDLVAANPRYAEAAAQREHVWKDKAPPPYVTLGFHLETLRSAGFREVGTIWQYLDDYIACAIR
ncbi:class I SAM-dependent methyltransferase [Devosia sp.]|uniref:class I SAM-dependent methyltransferase n=1 Tax=Devosia sp. TaxID=1871048 RepID=UPI003A8D83B6